MKAPELLLTRFQFWSHSVIRETILFGLPSLLFIVIEVLRQGVSDRERLISFLISEEVQKYSPDICREARLFFRIFQSLNTRDFLPHLSLACVFYISNVVSFKPGAFKDQGKSLRAATASVVDSGRARMQDVLAFGTDMTPVARPIDEIRQQATARTRMVL